MKPVTPRTPTDTRTPTTGMASARLLLSFLLLSTWIYTSNAQSVTGYQGREVTIRCPYQEGYGSDYQKYLCKGDCGDADVLIESRVGVSDEIKQGRYSIRDDAGNRTFNVTISNLQDSDKGQYWCGVSRTGRDLYTWVHLEVIPFTRGFFGHRDPQGDGLVTLDQGAAWALGSPLTTVLLPLIYMLVFVVALPTNAMALWVFLFRTKKKHPASIYMANLALADLLFVVWIPLKISYHLKGNDWIYGEALCKVLVGFFYGNMYCSILFIACLSVQRYWVVSHPLSGEKGNNKVAIAVCAAIWLFIGLTTVPLYQYDHTVRVRDLNITTCHDINPIDTKRPPFDQVRFPYYYFMLMSTVVFLLPCLVIVVSYVLLFRWLENNMVDSTATKNRRKALVLIMTVLVTFLICFVPSNIMLVVHYSLLGAGRSNNGYGFYVVTLCLASLNSILDPFIYYFVSDGFREHVKNTLRCRSARAVERSKVSFDSMKYSKKTRSYVSGTTDTTDTSGC